MYSIEKMHSMANGSEGVNTACMVLMLLLLTATFIVSSCDGKDMHSTTCQNDYIYHLKKCITMKKI